MTMNIFRYSLIFIFFFFQFTLWFGKNGVIDYIEYLNKAKEQKIENNKLSLRNTQMFKKINDLEKGHESIEEKARFNLGFIKKDETYFNIQ